LRTQTINRRRASTFALALLIAIPSLAAAAQRRGPADLCLTTPPGDAFNALLFQDVPAGLAPGRSIAVHGLYFTHALKGIPFDGSAAMSTDGTIRIGLFVHASAGADSTSTVFRNDFTLSGPTDASFAGTVSYDNDGDYLPNGTINLVAVDCGSLTIP